MKNVFALLKENFENLHLIWKLSLYPFQFQSYPTDATQCSGVWTQGSRSFRSNRSGFKNDQAILKGAFI